MRSIVELKVNMSVFIPIGMSEKFLTELVRDESVAVKFCGHTLILSMPDIEPMRTPYDGNMSQDEIEARDNFYKSLNFVHSVKFQRNNDKNSIQ